jgi:N-formylglutamate deformylase
LKPVEIDRGSSCLVLGLPHTGRFVPADIFSRLTPVGQSLRDTDWHIERLYSGLLENITTVRATFHRYVIDANRDPLGTSLYPGQNTTGLVPVTDFDGQALWLVEPTASEIEARRAAFHEPYHRALAAEIERVRAHHGQVILYDCHSIRSKIPFLFEGTLPDLNIGTNDGASCAGRVADQVVQICTNTVSYSSVLNGRFKGGWTTRYYGRPEQGVHAIQMELAQRCYLDSEEPPFAYNQAKADQLRTILERILRALSELWLSSD